MGEEPLNFYGYVHDQLHLSMKAVRRTAKTVRDSDDPEAVHKFRVALRRLRAALRALRLWRDDFYLKHIDRALKKIADRTSELRDIEVMLALLEELDLDEVTRAGLPPLATAYHAREKELRAELRALLDEPDVLLPLKQLKAYLILPRERPDPPSPIRPALKSIERVLQPVHKKLKVIEKRRDRTPWLHRLRIDCKRLRYTVDFFEGLLPAEFNDLSRSARRMQNRLGDLHDCDFILDRLAADRLLEPAVRDRIRTQLEERRAAVLERTIQVSGENARTLANFV